jgi:hypothetical protein
MPTFLLFKGGKKVGEMKGANPQQLEMLIRSHTQISSPDISNLPYVPAGYQDLINMVEQTQLDWYCCILCRISTVQLIYYCRMLLNLILSSDFIAV